MSQQEADNLPMPDDVTLVVVTFNSSAVLPALLEPLKASPHIIVVDNASSDDSVACVKRLVPHARILRSPGNVGFGRANNLALEQVATPFALLLNPDCVASVESVCRLLEAARRYPDAAMLAPKLYDAPGQLGLCYRPGYFSPQPAELLEPSGDLCSEFLTGAALLLRMDAMRRIGFFDPWFFLYLEDDDLCLRVRRAGHSLVLVNDAHVMHGVRRSSAPSARMDFRRAYCLTLSKLYLTRKYLGAGRSLAEALRILAGALLSLPVRVLTLDRARAVRDWARLLAVLRAPARLRAKHCLPDG